MHRCYLAEPGTDSWTPWLERDAVIHLAGKLHVLEASFRDPGADLYVINLPALLNLPGA